MAYVEIHVTNSLINFRHSVRVGRYNGQSANYRAAAIDVAQAIQAKMDALGARGGDGARAIAWLLDGSRELHDREAGTPLSCGLWAIDVEVIEDEEPDDGR